MFGALMDFGRVVVGTMDVTGVSTYLGELATDILEDSKSTSNRKYRSGSGQMSLNKPSKRIPTESELVKEYESAKADYYNKYLESVELFVKDYERTGVVTVYLDILYSAKSITERTIPFYTYSSKRSDDIKRLLEALLGTLKSEISIQSSIRNLTVREKERFVSDMGSTYDKEIEYIRTLRLTTASLKQVFFN